MKCLTEPGLAGWVKVPDEIRVLFLLCSRLDKTKMFNSFVAGTV